MWGLCIGTVLRTLSVVALGDLRRLNVLGYRIGIRVLELLTWRTEGASKAPKREIRFIAALMSIHTQVWKAVFGKPADAIEKSVEHEDECEFVFSIIYTRLIQVLWDRHDH